MTMTIESEGLNLMLTIFGGVALVAVAILFLCGGLLVVLDLLLGIKDKWIALFPGKGAGRKEKGKK